MFLFFSSLDSFSFQKFLLLNIIPSFDMPFLDIYIFISLDPFGKFETTQISGCLHKPKLLRIIDLLRFAKLLELLAINHSSSKRMDTCLSVVETLPRSGCFTTCMGAHFPAVELDWTTQGVSVPVA